MNNAMHPHGSAPVHHAGAALADAHGAVILIHGRGDNAANILTLSRELQAPGVAYLAPQATGNTWYPHRFLEPMELNEPYLTSALTKVEEVVAEIVAAGVPHERVVILGFSQGACLASEFVARHARRWGGLVAFSGGVIGPDDTPRDYPGALDGTPVFIGGADNDPHVPLERMEETGTIMERLGGEVDLRIYNGMGHTINRDEIGVAHTIISAIGR